MQTDYQNMTMATLMDMLARETQKFTQFMSDKNYGLDYERCKEVIQQVQAAIKVRQEENEIADNRNVASEIEQGALPGRI